MGPDMAIDRPAQRVLAVLLDRGGDGDQLLGGRG